MCNNKFDVHENSGFAASSAGTGAIPIASANFFVTAICIMTSGFLFYYKSIAGVVK
ncbi:MAG: hypothetical protein LBL87_00535 [Ruminococcus sp.]|nr:hypothetical protein [Ruminococcus sp.]